MDAFYNYEGKKLPSHKLLDYPMKIETLMRMIRRGASDKAACECVGYPCTDFSMLLSEARWMLGVTTTRPGWSIPESHTEQRREQIIDLYQKHEEAGGTFEVHMVELIIDRIERGDRVTVSEMMKFLGKRRKVWADVPSTAIEALEAAVAAVGDKSEDGTVSTHDSDHYAKVMEIFADLYARKQLGIKEDDQS